jgi:glycogen debranching enzyme
MNSVNISIANEEFLRFVDNMIEITHKFNPQRVNSSYINDGLVHLVVNSNSTDFIYKRASEFKFYLEIYSNSNYLKNLEVGVNSVSSFFSELIGTHLFNNYTTVEYFDIINAESIKLSFLNSNEIWHISIFIDPPSNSVDLIT